MKYVVVQSFFNFQTGEDYTIQDSYNSGNLFQDRYQAYLNFKIKLEEFHQGNILCPFIGKRFVSPYEKTVDIQNGVAYSIHLHFYYEDDSPESYLIIYGDDPDYCESEREAEEDILLNLIEENVG